MSDNCLIVCSHSLAGVPGHVAEIVQDAFSIAVDGGLKHFRKLKLKPMLWVGDGDSISRGEVGKLKCKKIRLPKAKDYSDFEYALHLAGKAFLDGEWEGNVVLVGAQGGRFDHELGNLLVVQTWMQDLARAAGPDNCPGLVSYGPRGMWIATMSQLEFQQPRGQLFSVMCLEQSPKITITGAKYQLKRGVLDHASRGLSNEGVGKTVQIRVEQLPRTDRVTPVFVIFPRERDAT
ncbi:MAG: thiamine diphosphokinase [Deltaproteobacteria bacterium]|nr:thiamine diphosphokinase [Deltaproteobacteria bacterium]